MKSLLVCYTFPLVLVLVSFCDAQSCLRRFEGQPDCGTLTDSCTMDSVSGPDLNAIPFPPDNMYTCYRTCYENGQDGNCIATQRFEERPVDVYANDTEYIAMKFSSPRYRNNDNSIGNYRKSNICRYHVKCSGTKRLYYSITGQTMQDTAECSGMSEVCVDRVRIIFPGIGECERCSTLTGQVNINCKDRSGLGNEMMVEFTANREADFEGFEMLLNCVEPGFDQNIPPPSIGKRQVSQECSSPQGMGPQSFPSLPPTASRIQQRLDNDPNAIFIVLRDSEDQVTYNNYTLTVQREQESPQVFSDISVLEVENTLDVRRYYRIAPGFFSGLAQLAIFGDSAILVQFGINPSLLPSEEEDTISALLDSAIADAVAQREIFDVEDELDILEQNGMNDMMFRTTVTPDLGNMNFRKKRGINPQFVEDLAMEYGNACNGVLRTSACIYQQVILGRSCTDI